MSAAQAGWRRLSRAGQPTVFNIPASVPFVDALAQGLLTDAGDDPLALAAVTVLLPTRRAARSLREAFLRLTEGDPLLLPRMMPLNDVDSDETLFGSFATGLDAELPVPIAPLRRQLLLALQVEKFARAAGETPRPEQAIQLAAELARLLDQVQTEGLDFTRLEKLVPDTYATHWQITLKFLEIVTTHWPDILRENGVIDPADHRNRVFALQAKIWAAGAHGPVVAAGSTGSIPATADLLSVIARMKDGCVVLPGLDTVLDDPSWALLEESHPQFGLKHLLARIGMERDAVAPWPAATTDAPTSRERLVSECMRPAKTTDRWTQPGGALSELPRNAVDGLTRLDCAGPREEAETVALLMRDAVQTLGRTCALVTPDRRLAERVASQLERWELVVDDSAGKPLERTAVGAFLRLTAAMALEDFAPVATLAVCKHPFAACGQDTARFRDFTRTAEIALLRGPRPPAGLAGLASLVPVDNEDAREWLALLTAACGKFPALVRGPAQPLATLLAAHMEMVEALADTPETPGPLRVWAGDAGEAAAAFIAELSRDADVLAPIDPASYLAVLEALMAGRVVRPRYGRHPRLAILGPLEARLQRFDVLILSGLNEGTWPADAQADPWMNRPMRQQFGLPSPERRIGLAAHDIAQALCAPRVVLTRAVKVDGTPTVPSRWLMRLARVVAAAKIESSWKDESGTWPVWAHSLTRPEHEQRATPAPAPTPPVAARPRRLSVTDIEKWMRDPYSIYARHVLDLKPLDPLEQDPGAADYGSLIHEALDRFVRSHPSGNLPADALEKLIAVGHDVFGQKALRPGIQAFWWPRFARIATWFVETETARRGDLIQAHVEIKGEMTLKGPAGPFVLRGRADRIDEMKDGIAIIDYKTGAPPRSREVLAGFAPQLPLEAAMIAAGGFEGIPKSVVRSLAFWQLHGRDDGGDIEPIKGDATEMAKTAREGLEKLIATFDQPETPYAARPNPETAPTYSDYLHLARVKEWGSVSGGEGS